MAATLFNDNMKKSFRFVTESMLPYFVFIMYLINRGTTITQAMFFNCDHSMLTYNFYRKPKTLLEVFKTRLLTMIKINMIPALVIAAGPSAFTCLKRRRITAAELYFAACIYPFYGRIFFAALSCHVLPAAAL